MVIHSNMSPEVIVEVWEVKADIFKEYKIPLIKQTLDIHWLKTNKLFHFFKN
ncbi:hypothetical protein R4Z09_11745 [Niallia oryzisoli]|uniref:Uncharacterized protein n=1 Tax=Niallia oryzisoli TaxID=1737571 RepID=A0ABZ2CII6_9BACI